MKQKQLQFDRKMVTALDELDTATSHVAGLMHLLAQSAGSQHESMGIAPDVADGIESLTASVHRSLAAAGEGVKQAWHIAQRSREGEADTTPFPRGSTSRLQSVA